MRSSTTPDHNISTATHTYSPSVPLSVYRELAADLQAVEAMLDSLDAQNQQLAKQNQQLRQEIEKAVQSVLHLKQIANSAPQSNRLVSGTRQMYRSSRPPSGVRSAVKGSPPFLFREASSVYSKKMFTEQKQGQYGRRSQPDTASQISGWWLAIAILLIIATAFGAGYLIVRPVLQSR